MKLGLIKITAHGKPDVLRLSDFATAKALLRKHEEAGTRAVLYAVNRVKEKEVKAKPATPVPAPVVEVSPQASEVEKPKRTYTQKGKVN